MDAEHQQDDVVVAWRLALPRPLALLGGNTCRSFVIGIFRCLLFRAPPHCKLMFPYLAYKLIMRGPLTGGP